MPKKSSASKASKASKKRNRSTREPELLELKLKQVRGTIFRKSEGTEVLVVNIAQPDKFYRMDAWAAVFWKSLNGKSTLKAVCSKIRKESGLKEDLILREASALAKRLLKLKLIEKAGT